MNRPIVNANKVSTSIRIVETDLWFIDATASILGYKNRGDAMFAAYVEYLEQNHSDNHLIRAALEQREAKFLPPQRKAA